MLALYDRIEAAAETVSAIIAAQHHSVHARVPGPGDDPLRRGLRARRPADRLRRRAAHGDRRPPRRRGRRSGARWRRSPRPRGAREVRIAADEAEARALATARRNAFSALARAQADDDSRGRHRAAQRAGGDGRLHRRDRRAASACTSARSATWATATCTRRSSPTSATPTEMHRVRAGARRDRRRRRSRSAARSPASTASASPRRRSSGSRSATRSFELMQQRQARPRSPRHSQSRQDLRLNSIDRMTARPLQDARLLRAAAVHALRDVPADVPDLRCRRSASGTARAAGSR